MWTDDKELQKAIERIESANAKGSEDEKRRVQMETSAKVAECKRGERRKFRSILWM